MVRVERVITIHAPAEQVFQYMMEPKNLLEFWPSMVEVKDVIQKPTGVGNSFTWVYKMAGVHFTGRSENLEVIPNRRIVTKNTGGIPSTIVWEFESKNGETVVHNETHYELPASLLGHLAEPFILKMNEHEADVLMANLKARMEMAHQPERIPS